MQLLNPAEWFNMNTLFPPGPINITHQPIGVAGARKNVIEPRLPLRMGSGDIRVTPRRRSCFLFLSPASASRDAGAVGPSGAQ